jgi:hypothetical protein
VSDELWKQAHSRLNEVRSRMLRLRNGQVLGRPPAVGSAKYLLSGLLTCGQCGAALEARTRSHGRKRVPYYGCSAHWRKGGTVCSNNVEIPLADAEESILAVIERCMLDPELVADILTEAVSQLKADAVQTAQRTAPLEQELTRVES